MSDLIQLKKAFMDQVMFKLSFPYKDFETKNENGTSMVGYYDSVHFLEEPNNDGKAGVIVDECLCRVSKPQWVPDAQFKSAFNIKSTCKG